MVRHIRSPASPSHISGFVARQRTVSGEERAGAHLRDAALRGDLVGAVRWLAAGVEQAAVVNSSDGDGTDEPGGHGRQRTHPVRTANTHNATMHQ